MHETMKERAINFKKNREGHIKGLEGGKRREKCYYVKISIKEFSNGVL